MGHYGQSKIKACSKDSGLNLLQHTRQLAIGLQSSFVGNRWKARCRWKGKSWVWRDHSNQSPRWSINSIEEIIIIIIDSIQMSMDCIN